MECKDGSERESAKVRKRESESDRKNGIKNENETKEAPPHKLATRQTQCCETHLALRHGRITIFTMRGTNRISTFASIYRMNSKPICVEHIVC